MTYSFYSYSFGCRVNYAEKLEIDQRLISTGLVQSDDNPDFIILNSCAVTNKAEREVRQYIYSVRKKFPNAILIVTGCAITNWLNRGLYQNISDYYFDNTNKSKIVSFIYSCIKKQNPRIQEKFTGLSDKFLNSQRMLIKIQEGCLRFCTYCIVPYLRGKPVLSKWEDITSQINSKKKANI